MEIVRLTHASVYALPSATLAEVLMLMLTIIKTYRTKRTHLRTTFHPRLLISTLLLRNGIVPMARILRMRSHEKIGTIYFMCVDDCFHEIVICSIIHPALKSIDTIGHPSSGNLCE